MEWFILILVVVMGLVLLILEFLVIPGTGVVGILGLAAIVFAAYLGYYYYGTPAGHYILLGIALTGFAATFWALRAKTWKRLSLNAAIDSSVEGIDEQMIHPGDTGYAVGRLAPMGKVKIGDITVEGESQSGYIDANQEVEVLKVYKNKVVVKLKNNN